MEFFCTGSLLVLPNDMFIPSCTYIWNQYYLFYIRGYDQYYLIYCIAQIITDVATGSSLVDPDCLWQTPIPTVCVYMCV